VLVREQAPLACLLEHGLEESLGNVPIEQALAVLGEHGHIPNGVVQHPFAPRCFVESDSTDVAVRTT
jgi:hypothetical protein